MGRFSLIGLGFRICPGGSSHTSGRAWGSQVLVAEPLSAPWFTPLKSWNPTVAWPQVRSAWATAL